MAKLSKDQSSGTLHPREDLTAVGNLALANAEVILTTDGCSNVSLDLRGTFVGTIEVSGTVDGTNWLVIPIRPLAAGGSLYQVSATTAGSYVAACQPFAKVRTRMTAFTSGSALTVLCAGLGLTESLAMPVPSPLLVTGTAAVGIALTLTLPAATGLFHHITSVTLTRFATSALTPAATPVLATTTNVPGALVFTLPADAAGIGAALNIREEYGSPLRASASAATTIVLPATPGVIWRATATYYLAT